MSPARAVAPYSRHRDIRTASRPPVRIHLFRGKNQRFKMVSHTAAQFKWAARLPHSRTTPCDHEMPGLRNKLTMPQYVLSTNSARIIISHTPEAIVI